ncbi:MAG: YhfC family intramembrane metalloprotease [Bacillota bacterium]
MKVSNLSITLLVLSTLVAILAPFVVYRVLNRTQKLSRKAVLIGAATFVVFALILEQLLHAVVIPRLQGKVLLTIIYGCLAAGIFEEVGRYLMYKTFLKGKTEWKDGIAFGLGHGGIEAILLVGVANIQAIVMAVMVNAGRFGEIAAKLPKEVADNALNSLVNTPPLMFAASGVERLFALVLQIFFSLVVLYGIRCRKNIYLIYAILAHALMDVSAALYQTKVITSVSVIFLALAVMAVGAFYAIVKFKRAFAAEC